MSAVEGADRHHVQRVLHAGGLLRAFNDAGVLAAADVHAARRLERLGEEPDEGVLLAAALAVRAPRRGSVCVDLTSIRQTVSTTDDDAPADVRGLPWPAIDHWLAALTRSRLVAAGDESDGGRPLRLVGSTLYVDRLWREEQEVAADLHARALAPAPAVDLARLRDGLARLFPATAVEPDLQRVAGETAVRRRLTVVAGGPGTGKTTTVARILALLDEQATAAGAPPPLIALAAPTGKAAARLAEAVHDEAERLDVAADVRGRLRALPASTLHRLLGSLGGGTRFRHHRRNRLPHDVVVVDETSMVSLSLMARLLEAVRPAARLVLVGDPQQLESVEAGAVLGDIVAASEVAAPAAAPLRESIVVLRRGHRFAGAIARLADAVREGDVAAALTVLRAGGSVRFVEVDVGDPGTTAALAPLRDAVIDAGRRVATAAIAGDAGGALAALGAFRLLCAHRRGPYGIATWNARVERWLASAVGGLGEGEWYPGRPLLMTANDYALQLYNGDTGVVVAAGADRSRAVFARSDGPFELDPARLHAVETAHAMTIHKSQGSQADAVAVLLPAPDSPILTRELLYTAVTRARSSLIVCGTQAAVEAALTRRAARASGLARSLTGT